jgi:Na+/melibiose symporter-like transporter
MQQLVLMGTFFVLPVYLQIVVGLDAFETGKRLFPMSISMLVAALGGPRLAARFAPRRVAQLGFVAIAAAAFLLTFTIDVHLDRWHFSVALAIFGVGAGLLISQLGNVIMSSVDPSHSNEAGGLQGTAQNLGASVGTALIGAIMLTFLTSAFVSNISDNPALSQKTQTAITQAAADNGLDVVPIPTVEAAAQDAGLSAHDAEAVASDYGDALLGALSKSLAGVGVLALLGLLLTRGLPARSAQREPVPLAGDAVSGARR